jgi:hypothetical protein
VTNGVETLKSKKTNPCSKACQLRKLEEPPQSLLSLFYYSIAI